MTCPAVRNSVESGNPLLPAKRGHSRPRVLYALRAVFIGLSCAAAISRAVADEFVTRPVNVPAGAHSAEPSVTRDGAGGFVLTWLEQADSTASLHFARIDREGQVVGQGTIARSTPDQSLFVNWADFPGLAVLDNGDWVSFWLQKSGLGPYAYDVWLARSTDQGKNWSEPRLLNRDGTQSEHGFVTLVPAGEDRVLALWLDGRNTVVPEASEEEAAPAHHAGTGGAMSLRSAVLDGQGRINWETEVDNRTCDCCGTDAVRIGEEVMVVYRDRSETEIRDISFSLGQAGGAWSKPQQVHADNWQISACPVNGPALASIGNQVLTVWTTMRNEELLVRAALGSRAGFGAAQDIESGPGVQGRVDAAAWGEQAFLLTWMGQSDAQAADSAIKFAEMDLRGALHGQRTIAELPSGRNTGFPRIASSGKLALLAWTEPTASGSSIRVLRISPGNPTAPGVSP